jgi:putative aminopeptidase FrvX
MDELRNDIELFCNLCGTSGFEEVIAKAFAEKLESDGISVHTDNLGNVIGKKSGENGAVSVMFAAHMDEVGLVTQFIDEHGFIRFDVSGLVDPRVLPGTLVSFDTKNGPCHGVVGAKPSHLLTDNDRSRPLEVGELWIDIGASTRDEVARAGIQIGDPATYQPNFRIAKNGLMFSKALDNRIGLALLLDISRRGRGRSFPFDLYLVGTVQEELGGRGARTAAQAINPTVALVLDTVSAVDPVARPPQATAEIGQGPAIRTLDFRAPNQGTVYSRKLRDFLIDLSQRNGLPYQLDIFRTWTDASSIQFVHEGIATLGIFVPRRYSHSPVEVAQSKDVEVTARLIWEFLGAVQNEKLRSLQKRF